MERPVRFLNGKGACLFLVLLLVTTGFVRGQSGAVSLDALIQEAGNADDSGRIDRLERIRTHPNASASVRRDAARLIEETNLWLTEPELDYFTRKLDRETWSYSFGIEPASPLYPLTRFLEGRMVAWYAMESGNIWNVPDQRRIVMDRARELLVAYRNDFPENRLVRMYLGEAVPNPKAYAPLEKAPDWANYQRESIERLTDIIEWWIDNRQQSDGQYGGGWGDDCEMWRWWMPALIAFDDPKITAAQARFSTALLAQDHMEGGYTDIMTDVEHTAEDGADAITPMMFLDPENPEWRDRSLRLVDLMANLWTGVNERGGLQYKSTYFTSDSVSTDPRKAADTVYHPRAVQPALLYWQRSGNPAMTALFSRWLDTWVDATARSERGKPAGIVPSALHWPEGIVGGFDPNWWDPGNHSERSLYTWPSAMGMMLNSLLLGHRMTGDARYVEPIRSMAGIRLDYLRRGAPADPPPGSADWCASRMRGLTEATAKYRFLTGSREFDELLSMENNPYLALRMNGDRTALTEALRNTAASLSVDWPGYTYEVRWTDRVLRFPALFAEAALYPEPLPGRFQPETDLLLATLTGEPGSGLYFPMNAVRWLTPPREMAAVVTDSGPDRFEAELFHFGTTERPMEAELYLLKPGAYTLSLTRASDGAVLYTEPFTMEGARTRVPLMLPSQTLCRLSVQPR